MFEKYFPWGIAKGTSFLGRKKEINRLKNNVTHGRHTLLLSPRRYGKTSLAKHALNVIGYPWVEIDLFIAQDALSVERKILKGVQSILSQIDEPEHWLSSLIKFFRNTSKTWTVGVKGLTLELVPEHHKDVPQNILEALQALEHALEKKEKRVVLFIDEFQEIANIKISRAIEGAIRHVAQSSRHIMFIFSGSSRHMLKHMFDNKSRPLYALCDQINLERLPAEEYYTYLNKVALTTWGKQLDQAILEKIIHLTECHSRYVYLLCACLWDHCEQLKKIPTSNDLDKVWDVIVNDKLKDIRELLSKRAMSQNKILALIALGYCRELTGQLVQGKLGISGSAITQALKLLEQADYLEKGEDNSYRIVDPLIKTMFIRYGVDYFC